MAMNEIHQDRRLSTDVDWLGGKLLPLRAGQGVIMRLIEKRPPARIKRIVPAPDKVVTIVPGPVFGQSARIVQVAVLNNGCCFVEIDCNKIAGMVRAGIPARLAKALLIALQKTLKEENYGNRTDPSSTTRKKRPSRGASGFQPRPRTVTTVTRSRYRST